MLLLLFICYLYTIFTLEHEARISQKKFSLYNRTSIQHLAK